MIVDVGSEHAIDDIIASAEHFDIKLNQIKGNAEDGSRLLRKLGMSENKALRTVENLPLVVKRDIPSDKVKKIYKALEGSFEIDLIPSG